jgi:surfeit locus 1 family protein
VDRSALPKIETPASEVRLEGRIAPPPSKLYAFDAVETGPIRQNLDLAGFSAETRLALLGVSVLQTGPEGDGLLRDWPEADLGVAKHYGYAFQWFALSGLIAVLYVWFQIVRPLQHQRRKNDGA